MLDFSHIPDSPNVDIQKFYGDVSTTLIQWKTWRKPRGCKFVYMIGVGGGGSGGVGLNTGTTSGGGAGGGSGAQSSVLIPAMFVPDILYVQVGRGGVGVTTSAAVGATGVQTLIAAEPYTSVTSRLTFLLANPGVATGTAATITAGGAAGTAAAVATIADMPLAGKGAYQFFAGQAGGAGGSSTVAPTALATPATGLMVTGGAGGGGTGGATALAGANITGVGLGNGIFPTVPGGAAGTGATPAGRGAGGFIAQNFMLNYGGTGGGGATTTAGGLAGAGGNGAPGCGGGGGGGATTTNTTLLSGDGGPGFAYIISW